MYLANKAIAFWKRFKLCFYKDSKDAVFRYKMAVVAIMKNEGDYIKEWLDFHLKVGVEHFFIYNNDSTDDMLEILRPYEDMGVVTVVNFPGRKMQIPAYYDAMDRFKNEAKYIAVIDGDEFLMPVQEGRLLADVVDEILVKDWRAGAVAVNWRMYGSSGHDKKPEGGVLKNFLYRVKEDGPWNNHVKQIVNPRMVYKFYHPHCVLFSLIHHSIDEDGKVVKGPFNDFYHTPQLIRINHYFCKSKEEWIKRRSQGTVIDDYVRTMDEFNERNRNDIFDDIALRYID